MLVNAKLTYAPGFIKWFPFHRDYVDFTENWFYDLAPNIVKMMISLGVVPWVEFILFFLIKSIRRYRDSGSIFSHHNHKTKCCTQKQYVDLYGGGDFQIHFRYASIMTMVFLSFMYGMAIPILFPVTLFGITSIYVNERVLLAYSYKKPPPLDEDLELRSYKFLKFAPLLMFLIGYWSLSN